MDFLCVSAGPVINIMFLTAQNLYFFFFHREVICFGQCKESEISNYCMKVPSFYLTE